MPPMRGSTLSFPEIVRMAWASASLPNKPGDSDPDGSRGVGTTLREQATSPATSEPSRRGGGVPAPPTGGLKDVTMCPVEKPGNPLASLFFLTAAPPLDNRLTSVLRAVLASTPFPRSPPPRPRPRPAHLCPVELDDCAGAGRSPPRDTGYVQSSPPASRAPETGPTASTVGPAVAATSSDPNPSQQTPTPEGPDCLPHR